MADEKSAEKTAAKAPDAKAKEIMKQYGVKKVWMNSRGEFFTSENNAINSEINKGVSPEKARTKVKEFSEK